MLVRDAMSSETLSVSKEDTVKDAVAKMITHHFAWVAVTEGDELIGVVSIRDTMMPLYPDHGEYVHDSIHSRDFEEMEESYANVMEKKVSEVMTSNPVVVSADDPVLKAASFMGLRNLRRIPVKDNGKFVGVVSIENINSGLFIRHGL
ncbi:MAG: CBS domain-containing protein [Mariprofundaceae bacterium]